MQDRVSLDHGSGGRASQRMIKEIFVQHLGNSILNSLDDAAFLQIKGNLSISTDTFTIDPIFFPGGNIGSLAVHGTVNDVAMLGAKALYLTCGFVLEEGLKLNSLEEIVSSMAESAQEAGVKLVSGDTKVVPKASLDQIFINTTGIGQMLIDPPLSGSLAQPGDAIILSGTIGDHGLAVLSQREGLKFESKVLSDSAPLNKLIQRLVLNIPTIHVLRDPTRGGLATTLNEIAQQSQVMCLIQEASLPVRPEVKEGCSFLGLDPLFLANEGKFICILPKEDADKALEIIRQDTKGRDAVQIGQVLKDHPGKVILKTNIGGERIVNMLEGEHLPRIC